MNKRAIFLDRDGVLNDLVDRGDAFEVRGKKIRWSAPYSFQEFSLRSEVPDVLRDMRSLGLLQIVVTNQPDIAYGFLPEADHQKIMATLMQLPLDDAFVCLHTRTDGCSCKKPKPGLLLQAAEKWGIDLASSYIIGDREVDVLAGQAVGCKPILIESAETAELVVPFRASNLRQAFEMIQEDLQHPL